MTKLHELELGNVKLREVSFKDVLASADKEYGKDMQHHMESLIVDLLSTPNATEFSQIQDPSRTPKTQVVQQNVLKAAQISTALAKDEALTQINTASSINKVTGIDVGDIKKVAAEGKGKVAEGGNAQDIKHVDDKIKDVGINPEELPKLHGAGGGTHVDKGNAGGLPGQSVGIDPVKPGENKGPRPGGH